MPLPIFMFMIFLYFWFSFLSPFIVAKILSKDYRLNLKESIYIVLTSMFCTAIRVTSNFTRLFVFTDRALYEQPFIAFNIIASGILADIFLFFYLYKLKSYTVKKATILAIFSLLFSLIANTPVRFVFMTYLGLLLAWTSEQALLAVSSSLSVPVLAALLTLFIVRMTGKLRNAINASAPLQTALLLGSIVSWSTYSIASYIVFFTETTATWWLTFYSLGYLGVSILSFFVYTRLLNAKVALTQKETEHSNLQFYLSEIEQQQTSIRKFKHDLQNLLSTLDIYVQDRDMDGLMQFYPKLRTASDLITKNEFELEGLSKIKIREIKNILVAKLIMAQNLELDIRLEIGEEIDGISVDSIAIVRMIGIILDNAIEELQELDEGVLYVACFNIMNAINFTVQNTCRADILPLKQLRQPSFSTKGEGRGLGLGNLYELIDSLPNVSLMTSIEDGNFTQSLIIEGDAT